MLFEERRHLMEKLEKNCDKTAVEKLDAINSKIHCFSEFDSYSLLPPLYFCADFSNLGTLELKKRYDFDRKNIIEMKKKPRFMNLVLETLAN